MIGSGSNLGTVTRSRGDSYSRVELTLCGSVPRTPFPEGRRSQRCKTGKGLLRKSGTFGEHQR